MVTTIQIDEELKARLDSMKIHHRETYNELLLRLLGSFALKTVDRESLIETIDVLSDTELMKDLGRALKEEGNGTGLEDLKRELRINEV